MNVVRERDVVRGVQIALERVTGVRWGVGRAPRPVDGEIAPATPYGILYPLDVEHRGSPYRHPEADATCHFQATAVGEVWEQVLVVKDRVKAAVTERGSGGGFVHPLVVHGMTVKDRSLGSAAGIDSEGTLLSVPIRFSIDVTSEE